MAVDAMKERFDEVEFLGKPALFTDLRVLRNTIPELPKTKKAPVKSAEMEI